MIISLQKIYLIRFVILSSFLSFQTLSMSGDFKDFISLLDSDNQGAWDIIRFEMEQIIEYRCKEELIEMLWVYNGSEIPKNKTQFFDELMKLIHAKFKDSKPQFNNFRELKDFILDLSTTYIHEGFANFMLLLPKNHNRAWWRLDKDLKTKMVYWLVSAKSSNLLKAEQVYYDSLFAFTQAVKQKKLYFPTSKKPEIVYFQDSRAKNAGS